MCLPEVEESYYNIPRNLVLSLQPVTGKVIEAQTDEIITIAITNILMPTVHHAVASTHRRRKR